MGSLVFRLAYLMTTYLGTTLIVIFGQFLISANLSGSLGITRFMGSSGGIIGFGDLIIMEERLQKILARSGFGSRRGCEKLIEEGRVMVNGRLAQLGAKANPETDHIEVNGKAIAAPEVLKYIALYKPRNVISAVVTPDKRKTVRDLVDEPGTYIQLGG